MRNEEFSADLLLCGLDVHWHEAAQAHRLAAACAVHAADCAARTRELQDDRRMFFGLCPILERGRPIRECLEVLTLVVVVVSILVIIARRSVPALLIPSFRPPRSLCGGLHSLNAGPATNSLAAHLLLSPPHSFDEDGETNATLELLQACALHARVKEKILPQLCGLLLAIALSRPHM